MIDAIISTARVIGGLLLTLFLPGFAASYLVFPKNLDRIERIAISCVLSIAITMLMALFLDLILGVDFTGTNMTIALILFTLAAFAASYLPKALEKKKQQDPEYHLADKHVEAALTERFTR